VVQGQDNAEISQPQPMAGSFSALSAQDELREAGLVACQACCFSPSRVAVGVTTWTALAMCLLPMVPGCRMLTAAAQQKVQKEAEGSSSHCIGMLPFISACFVASDGVGIFV